jgi:hypothetical protein
MIIKIFKHAFIPHEHNDYKPHFFREASIITILVVSVILLSLSFGTNLYIKSRNMISSVLPAILVDLTNEARSTDGMLALSRNNLLDKAASLKAGDMSSYGYFAHTSPQGITPWYWFNEVGYYFIYAGENLAIDFTESEEVENAWLNSPTHKANILNNRFSEIGIATKEGYYNGHPTIYVVQMFGTPAFAEENKNEPTPPIVKENTDSTGNKTKNPETKIVEKENISNILALVPVVKGEQAVKEENLKTITETKEFVSVENTSANEESMVNIVPKETVKYSSWKDRLTFLFPEYVNRFYKIFAWIILAALVLMLFIEIRRQHPKNIMYGILLIIIIFCFIYINKSMFVTSLLI